MRRLSTFILACCYLAATLGMVVREHYCMGESGGMSVWTTDGRCPVCGMEKGKEGRGCCKDVQHIFKINQLHPGLYAGVRSFPGGVGPIASFPAVPPQPSILAPDAKVASPHGPPGFPQPIYIAERNFRV